MNNLIDKLTEQYPSFSKGQKLIADCILKHYDQAAFMTAAKLGEKVGVSESTVVRFAIEVGYDGYPKLQKALKDVVKSKLTSAQRLEVLSTQINSESVLKTVLQSDLNKIRLTLEEADSDTFDAIVEELLAAKKIYILGVRSSAALASFLGFYLNLISDDVRLINTNSVSEMFEQIVNATKGDVVLGISYPRYSRRTTKAMQFANNQGATVIALTDSETSPLAKCSKYSLFARSDMSSFVDSLVAPLSMINALIVAIGLKRKDKIHNTFERLEKIWDEYQVYEKGEYHNDLAND